MSNFLDDNLDIPNFPKVDGAQDATGEVDAVDLNWIRTYLRDIQATYRASIRTYTSINANAGTLAAGTPVYASSAGHFDAAKADAAGTALVTGLLIADCTTGIAGGQQHANLLTLTTAQWDARTGGSGGLTVGLYWLDPTTAGKLTATAPSTVGQQLAPIGLALSTTQMRLHLAPPIGL